MSGRRSLMPKISGGEVTFQFILVREIGQTRPYMCYVFPFIILSKPIFVFSLL
jgi:hypothetical protein